MCPGVHVELTGQLGRNGSIYVCLPVLATESRYSLQPKRITILFVCCEQMWISNTSGWPQTYHVAEDNIKLLIFQCFHPKFYDYRHVLPRTFIFKLVKGI